MAELTDKLLYDLPFRDGNINISQGYNGPFSHFKIRPLADQSYSLDFALDPGTEVLAARDGKVKAVYDSITDHYNGTDFENGSHFLANFIELVHPDGSFTCYQHLKPGFAEELGLKKGLEVIAGDKIAETGLTGWIGGIPHLHFSAYTRTLFKEPKLQIMNQSFPVEFRGYDGPFEHSDL